MLISRERSRNRIAAETVLPLLALTLCGCMSHSAVSRQEIRPVVQRIAPVSFSATADPVQTAVGRVYAHPLYRQAEQACREKRFGAAAELLARLAAMPGMGTDEIAFARQQRSVCLRDTGQPAPDVAFPRCSLDPAPRPQTPSEADCGPRALLLVCQKLDVPASLPRLREWAATTAKGTSMAGLAAAAKAAGLKAEGVQVSREALPEQEMPAVAYVNSNHFITVLSTQGSGDNATATVHDPNNTREETIPQERLLRLCSGYLLLVRR